MDSGSAPYLVFCALAAVFVASSLLTRRIPLGKAARMVLAWVAIFAVVFVLFAFRGDFASFGARLRAEATGAPIVAGQSVTIPMADDGHFWVVAKLNGEDVRFMVDSGASVTTVSRSAAQTAGIAIGRERGIVSTANGDTTVTLATADRLSVGPIEKTDFPVDISDRDDMNLLGMNFLSSLRGWRVEGHDLILQS